MSQDELDVIADKLRRIRSLVVGVGRTGQPNNGMDMLAGAVLRIVDEGAAGV